MDPGGRRGTNLQVSVQAELGLPKAALLDPGTADILNLRLAKDEREELSQGPTHCGCV